MSAPRTALSSGRYTFDFEAMQFRNAADELVPFEQVQAKVMASMDRASGRLGMTLGDDTLVRLDVGNRSLLGRNSGAVEGGTNVTLKPLNNITPTHGEGEVFQRFFDKGWIDEEGVLWVAGNPLCGACGRNGGVGSLLRATGMKQVVAITPDGTFLITAARPSRPIPITIR